MKKESILGLAVIILSAALASLFYLLIQLYAGDVKMNNHIKALERSVSSMNSVLREYREADKARSKNEAEALAYIKWRFVLKDQVDEARHRLMDKSAGIKDLKKDKALANLVYYNLGLSCVLASDFDSAINAFEEALKIDPQDASSNYNLGLLYSAYRNNPNKAIEYYNKYLKSVPKGPKSEEVKERIEALKDKGKS